MSTVKQFKAANHQKSVAWEAERFSEGDHVIMHYRGASSSSIYAAIPKSYTFSATRTNGGWTDNDTAERFETLSRWGRSRITTAYIPGIKCRSYNPKNSSTYLKVNESKYIPLRMLEPKAPAPQPEPAPAPQPAPQTLEDRMKYLEERLLATATLAIFLKQRVETLEAAQKQAEKPQSPDLDEVRARQQAAVKARASARAAKLRSKK